MLHILWMLIKFILIVLGILLGLVLLAILLLLFDPIRYRAQINKDAQGLKALTAEARVSWLFGLISLRVSYADGQPALDIRIFGIPLGKITGLLNRKKKTSAQPASSKKTKNARRKKNAADKTQPDAAKNPNPGKDEPIVPAGSEALGREKRPKRENLKNGYLSETADFQESKSAENPDSFGETAEDYAKPVNPQPDAPGLFSRIWGMLKTILGLPVRAVKFLFALPGKIAAIVQKIQVTIQNICDKIGWWSDFLQDEQTKAALILVKQQAGGLIRHVLPTKVYGDVTFGFEDPSLTGRILAVLGISYPLHKNRIAVTPLFDGENCLIGHVRLKGRIYGIVVLIAAMKILFNKNIKHVISEWKSKA